GYYWLTKFPAVWVPVVAYLVEVVVLLGIATIVTHILTKSTKLVSWKLLKRELRAGLTLKISQTIFVICLGLVVFGLIVASRKLAGHPIKLHIPVESKNSNGTDGSHVADGPEE